MKLKLSMVRWTPPARSIVFDLIVRGLMTGDFPTWGYGSTVTVTHNGKSWDIQHAPKGMFGV